MIISLQNFETEIDEVILDRGLSYWKNGHVVELEPMLEEYYHERGWDIGTGIPKRSKLEALGLRDVAEELGRLGKLPPE